MAKILYTVGHSNHQIDYFFNLLKTNNINCIIDVRSTPSSSYCPQYNKENLKIFLNDRGISYGHLGKEFGARRYDALNDNNQVDFNLAVQTRDFLNGVDRINKGLEMNYKIAFMCSEAEPLDCHRFAMISKYFSENGYDIIHILKDNTTKSNVELETQMLDSYIKKGKIKDVSGIFFNEENYNKEDQLRDAYILKNKEIAFNTTNNNEL